MSDDKPFVCTVPGCNQRFTNEDHLAVHKHKHEMTLKFGPARNDGVIVADQTPTPTRFLKNCEEVGLFNELTSPFEHDFKKATEDEIRKLPLDLSPLALPLLRSKSEEASVVESHRESPLPHPESTTCDDKDISLEPVPQPAPAVVRTESLQVPTVLLASTDASVVMQQALSLQTSNSIITQAPATSRPVVANTEKVDPGPSASSVSGTIPVLLQLPNGQTMPLSFPAAIANPTGHVPTTLPLVRPVAVTPNVPGIPGTSSPAPVQSEAKMRLKAVLTQQQPQLTNGKIGEAQSSTHTPPLPKPDKPCPQKPATSTTEAPARPTPPANPAPRLGGRRRRATSENPDEKRRKFLERNRAAASRCRQKRKVWVQSLEKKAEDLSSTNGQLQSEVALLRNEVAQLKQLLLAHKDCPVTAMQKRSAYHDEEEEGHAVEETKAPGSPPAGAIQHSSVTTSSGVDSSSSSSSSSSSTPVPAVEQSHALRKLIA